MLCYRCLGLYTSFYASLIILIIGLIFGYKFTDAWDHISGGSILIKFLFIIGLSIPYILDGYLQAATRWESKNPIRLITGLLGGTGFALLFLTMGQLFKLLREG